MPCARADKPEGPYEVNPAISGHEDFGIANLPMHQGGIVNTPTGEWWGFSMMDFNSLGRLTGLSPVTWQNGWPYFGLSGNLGRSPRTWVKPNTGQASPILVPYQRSDDFSGPKLKPIWQWNHAPDDTKWSLTERPGFLRLHSLPASEFWWARNTLTQRAIGPVSSPTAEVEARGMKSGDVAGLALLDFPYAWIGVSCQDGGTTIEQYDKTTDKTMSVPLAAKRVWLRAQCDFTTEKASFSYSTDGKTFAPLGSEFKMVFQLKTFQGVRYSLFHYNTGGEPGGYADFDSLTVAEPYPHGLRRPIPLGQTIALTSRSDGSVLVSREGALIALPANDARATPAATGLKVVDRGRGRVALQAGDSFISVVAPGNLGQVTLKKGVPTDNETFQWMETPYGDLVLLSLSSHYYLKIDPASGALSADSPGPNKNRKDGTCLNWK